MAQRKEHVVFFPFMAQGHIIPFLALALETEKRKGYQVTFINTSQNVKKLKSSLPPNSSIRFREIPFCSSDYDGLPPNIENTDHLPYHLIFRMLEVSEHLKPALRRLVSEMLQEEPDHPPLCIISDLFFGWAAQVAHEFDIAHAIFVGASAFGMACYFSLWTSIPSWKVEGRTEYDMEDFPEGGKVHVTQLPASMAGADGRDSWSIYTKKRLPEWYDSDGILFNSVEQLDEIGLNYFRRKLGRSIWPIGPILLKMESQDKAGKEEGCITAEACREWLDNKPSKSVLYICFGSQNTLTASQMMQLALALEASGKNFIWVVRHPLGTDYTLKLKAEDWLPKGFEQRMQDQQRGLLIKDWAPQVEILSHNSTGAFISHCGWNSVLEAISHGVPIIGWPMAAEQFFNVKLLVEVLSICVELGRGNGCQLSHEDIVKKIDRVMGENDEAERIRRIACSVRDIIQDANKGEDNKKGSSVKAMDEFFNTAIARREKTQRQNNGL